MADVELVIRIPKEMYNWVYDENKCSDDYGTGDFIDLIKNGTPLPKCHGRLIDADALKMDTRVCGDRYLSKTSLFVANKVIEQADTIIEADKDIEEKEKDYDDI